MKVILSCTTTYERSEIFVYCFQSLLKQTFTPDVFLINLSKDAYMQDEGFSQIPDWLKDERVKVNWVENTGSYRKLLPALEYAGEEDIIITVDDDVIYSKTYWKILLTHINRIQIQLFVVGPEE